MTKKRRKEKPDSGEFLESRLFKWGSKLSLALIVAVVFLTLVQCTVKKPECPVWNTQLTIPVVNRTYQMDEIIDKIDQEGIEMDSANNVVFSITREIDTIAIDSNNLSTANLSYSVSEQLGLINITAPDEDSVTVSLGEIGLLSAAVGQPIPATPYSVDKNLAPITAFESATFSSGQTNLVIENDLGLDLETATIELYDILYARSIGSQSLSGGITNGETDTAVFSLAGQTISNFLQARFSGTTRDGDTLDAASGEIDAWTEFPGTLTVSSARAKVPPLSRSFSEPVALDESDPVYNARLSSGNLQLNISNQTNLTADLTVSFPDLCLNGDSLTVIRTVNANSTAIVAVDLAGYDLSPSDSTVPQSLVVNAYAYVPGSGDQRVDIDQSDEFSVVASLSNLSFSSVTGIFSTIQTNIEPRQELIDLPTGFDSLELVSTVLTLEITNGVNLPGQLDITIQGNNGQTLNLSRVIAAGTLDSAVTTRIDTVVAGFLSPIPSIIDISGSASFGDGINEGTIHDDDFVCGSISINAPLELIINETTIETDIQSEELDIDDILDNIIEARLIYNVISHLPIGARVNVLLGSDSASLLTSAEVDLDDIIITAAPTDGNGIVTDTISIGYQQVVLDSLDVQVLRHDTLYIGTKLVLEGSGGQPVKLTSSDYLTVVGRIEVEYRFDGEF